MTEIDFGQYLSESERREIVVDEFRRAVQRSLKTANVVVKVEPAQRLVEVPEVGKWIEATTEDGKTHTFEVEKNTKIGGNTFLVIGGFPEFNVKTSDKGIDFPKSTVTGWKYVDAPVPAPVPIEIDGYWIARNREGRVVAYLTERDAKQGKGAQTGAYTVEEAEANIGDWASLSNMRKYIPALLAIIKFLERSDNEED